VGLFRRPREAVPLPVPRLDGSTWPARGRSGASFAASTLYELARDEAFAPATHDVVDVVIDEVLPLLDTGAAPQDEAHMRQVCSAAAQLGAGIGSVETRSLRPEPATTHPDIAAVLWLAADDLPEMPPHQRDVARYLLQCGYYLARTEQSRVAELTGGLWQEEHPAVRPGRDLGDSR
jgi:hypothetical protein